MSPAVMQLLPETAIPGLTTRRLWQAPELRSPGFVLLTVNKLYRAEEARELSESEIQQLILGNRPDILEHPSVRVFELSELREARIELETGRCHVCFPRHHLVLDFDKPESADDFFAKFARRVQEHHEVIVPKADVLKAMRSPLVAMFGVLCFMIAHKLVSLSYRDLTESRFLWNASAVELPAWYPAVDHFFQTFPPEFVGSLSGVVLALLQLWAYRRLTQPPAELQLVPRTSLSLV